MIRARALALALACAQVLLLHAAAMPAHSRAAAEMPCDVTAVPGSDRLADATTRIDEVARRLHVQQAHEITRGKGVRVAVLDGGIDGDGRLPVVQRLGVPGLVPERLTGHGTIVAGIIAAPRDGVAPAAQLVDVRVMDTESPDYSDGHKGVTSGNIAAGIRQLIAASGPDLPGVVNISLAVPSHDPDLERAVAELVKRDVVVVAAAGNRVESASEGEEFEGTPDSDAEVYPADYDGVVAVSAVPPGNEDPSPYVVPNRDTDVAAPTYGAISQNATGQRCVVTEVATSWAAAEVSGVVALLRSRYPKDNAKQVVARLLHSTEGSVTEDEARNPWTGFGVVQAHDALTRQLSPTKSGKVRLSEPQVRADAQAPPAPERLDLFGSSRALLLWFGLLAGALVALAFMLRPLLRRR